MIHILVISIIKIIMVIVLILMIDVIGMIFTSIMVAVIMTISLRGAARKMPCHANLNPILQTLSKLPHRFSQKPPGARRR